VATASSVTDRQFSRSHLNAVCRESNIHSRKASNNYAFAHSPCWGPNDAIPRRVFRSILLWCEYDGKKHLSKALHRYLKKILESSDKCNKKNWQSSSWFFLSTLYCNRPVGLSASEVQLGCVINAADLVSSVRVRTARFAITFS